MKQFINLSKIIINKSHIIDIEKLPNKYKINMISTRFSGFLIFGGGYFDTDNNTIMICEKKNAEDYKLVSDLIEQGF